MSPAEALASTWLVSPCHCLHEFANCIFSIGCTFVCMQVAIFMLWIHIACPVLRHSSVVQLQQKPFSHSIRQPTMIPGLRLLL